MWEVYQCEVVEFDILVDEDGCDLLRDDVFADLMVRIRAGEFFSVIIGTPCSTFSVARIPKNGVYDGGPRQLRDINRPGRGRTNLNLSDQRTLDLANILVERSVLIARAVRAAGGTFLIENPPTRSDPASELYRWMWRSHASLWMHPSVAALVAESSSRMATFPQCALGGEFQKWTSLLYSVELEPSLAHLRKLTCVHARHAKQATGQDPDGKWRSAGAAAYPAAMNALLGDACRSTLRSRRLHVGSSRPHAADGAEHVVLAGASKASSGSLRRLEPEVEEVLRTERFAEANAPPTTEWADAPQVASDPPGPFSTNNLMSSDMQARLHRFRIQVGACLHAARRGRWKWARDHRPEPLFATEEECLLPPARGWVWAYNDADLLWYAVTPSAWPHDPPPGDISTGVVVQYAREHGYSDMEIISFIAHGYPGPDLERCAVLGPPHVGALKAPEAFEKASSKDRAKGWVRAGYLLPPVWPMRADPMNIVFRNEKGRMTIDKTMQLVAGVDAYNSRIDLASQPAIDYVSVAMLGRACAIFLTSSVPVLVWGFDLEAYFRKTGKQRAHVWMSGFVHADGYGADERVQFGQREAPVLCGRQSCFLVWAIRRELDRLDAAHPPTDPMLRGWMQARRQRCDEGDVAWLWAALSFVLMYVDDVGAVSVDDLLYHADGSEWFVLRDGLRVRYSRAWLHFEAAIGVVMQFGHTDSMDKRVSPRVEMVFLGVTIALLSKVMFLSEEKAKSYRATVLDCVRSPRQPNGTVLVAPSALSSMMHKLLHAATVVPLGRQHLFHVMRSSKADARSAGGMKPLGAKALQELEWWAAKLQQANVVAGVPLASRTVFPTCDDPSVLTPYSDASREIGAVHESGYGAWVIMDGIFFYVEGRWSEAEVAMLDINALELAAMNIGSFTFLEEARRRGVSISHLCEFTDNTSAEYAADRGKPSSARLTELVTRRYDALYEMGVSGACERVASADNDIADGLSRGGEMLADALRMASAAQLQMVRLEAVGQWRDISYLLNLK